MRYILLFLLLIPSVLATGISNIPPLHERDMVIDNGIHMEYSFPVFGAEQLGVGLAVPPPLADYVTIYDPMPNGPPRTIKIEIDVPKNHNVPPGVYGLSLAANEIPKQGSQVATAVSASIGFILRAYSEELLLEFIHVELPSVPEGQRANFTAVVVSRTRNVIPSATITFDVLDEQGAVVATGHASHNSIASGELVRINGVIPTESLVGGIYKTRVRADYSDKHVLYDKSILRVGTLTIDLTDYTKQLRFNMTNKFDFKLESNWNKPLTNVLASVTLLGQEKRAAPEDILPFSKTETMEVYFDRTEVPPSQVEGVITVTYQELAENPALQKDVTEHTFTMPIYVDVVLPPEPAKVEKPFEFKPIYALSGVAVLLLLLNIVVLWFVLRKKKPPEHELPPV